ncbi:hypothetical protein Tco_1457501 [Tanacetum coccineum]
MSTAEAEYVSMSAYCAQVIWMRTQLHDYGYKYNRILMYYDSKSAIAISCNPVKHSMTKHIDVRYHFIKEHVEKGTVEIYFVGTEYQLADLFTKALPKERFEYLVHHIGMNVMTPTQLESLTNVLRTKRYELKDANKKGFDLDHRAISASKCKILTNISRITITFTLQLLHADPWMILWHTLAEHKSHEEQEARENVALVDEHLASEEIEKMSPRVIRKVRRWDPLTKETLVVEITNVVIPVNVNDDDEEITDEVYELKRREKGKLIEETRNSPIPTPIRSPRIHTNLISSDTEKLQELTDTPHTTSSSSLPHKKRYGYLFAHLRARFMPRKSFDTLADNLHDVMVETLPAMVDKHIKEQVMKQVPKQVRNQVPIRRCKLAEDIEYEAMCLEESSSRKVLQEEQATINFRKSKQDDDN